MVCFAENRNFLDASCWSVLVENGVGGVFLNSFLATRVTL